MNQSAPELVQKHDLDAAAIEALLQRYGGLESSTADGELTAEESTVREFLREDDEHPIRTSSDHYYQFTRSEQAEESAAPDTETAFTEALEALVQKGFVARSDDEFPRYSTSYYELLAELGRDYTASGVDKLCATTGMPKRQVYYHIFTDLHLDVDLTV